MREIERTKKEKKKKIRPTSTTTQYSNIHSGLSVEINRETCVGSAMEISRSTLFLQPESQVFFLHN